MKQIIFSEQTEQDKKKLQKFLLTNDINFDKNTLEAVIKIKIDTKENYYLKEIQKKINIIQQQIETSTQLRGLSYDVKIKQRTKLKQQLEELEQVEEICRRSYKFSEQLKSLFFVCIHYHFLQRPYENKIITLDQIYNTFKLIFFQKQVTSIEYGEILKYCMKLYNELKTKKKNKSVEKISKERRSTTLTIASRSITPKKISNQSIVELSTNQLQNYYTKLLQQTNMNKLEYNKNQYNKTQKI